MRRYWQPAALVDELQGRRPVKPVRLLGENLVLFRDEQGRYGLLRRHCPPLVRGTFKVGTEGDDGRGIRMAQAIGAAVRNMYAGEVSLPITPPRTLIHGILVNAQGQRFINEDTYMGRVGQSALYEQDGAVYLIVDEAGYEVNWMGLAASWVCETAAELESEIGLPAGSLQATLELYNRAADYARERGIIIADTKFEFGLIDGEITLADEVLTPDSSRFWPADSYEPGRAQPSYDKQYVRDYLESLHWNKQPPAPALPEEVARRTSEKYREAYRALTGHTLEEEIAAR